MHPRSFCAAILLAASALAAPPLTTIQDVLYKADGTRFNGTLTISWSSFEAVDRSAVVTQSTTVKVVDGNLRVQLVPSTTSTPAFSYSVVYNSDGRVQFRETWAVPSSTTPLRVRDVRVATANATAAPGNDTTGTPVQESDVVGLVADLGSRPLKGPAYAAGRVALVNATGAIESVSGDPSDCVRVDGSTGPCGASQSSFVDGDSPSGIVDGSNTVFSLSATPDPPSSLALYRNGLLQKTSQDYTLTDRTLQFVAASTPQPGDTLLASYRLTGDDSSSAPQPFPGAQVLCSGTGGSTTALALSSIGTCSIPAGLLVPGDRVEVRFDLAHQGAASGFSFELHWGATAVAHLDAAAAETLVTGRTDAAILAVGAQLSSQTWGSVLPFAATVSSSSDALAAGLTVDFQGKLSQSGDTLALQNFTVVRFP